MSLVVTDAVDPGPPQVMDGVDPGYGPGVAVAGSTPLKTLKQKIVTLTFSGTYAAGGYAIPVNQMGGLKALFVSTNAVNGLILVPTYNTDGTVTAKLYWRAADSTVLGEVPDTTAIPANTVMRALVWGREA